MTNNEKRVYEKTIGALAWISFFAAVFTALITFFASLSGENNGKEVFGIKLLIVASDSMSKSPLSENEEIFFNAGDLIIIKNVENVAELKVGDVITYVSYSPESYGKTVTHKIREIRYSPTEEINGFVTYGIKTGDNDTALVKPEYVIGKYYSKIPKIGTLFAFLKNPRGYFLVLLFPVILLIIFFSIKIGKTLGKKEFSEVYNEEMEDLKRRVGVLEEELFSKAALSPIEHSAIEGADFEKLNACRSENSNTEKDGEGQETEFVIPRGKGISFAAKLLNSEDKVKVYFNTVHNELVSFERIKSRISFRCISYRLGKKLLAKMTVRGKTLTLHLALDVDSFNERAFFQKDLSAVKLYGEVPFTVKIKSDRGAKNAIRLVGALAEKFRIAKNGGFKEVDAVKMLKISELGGQAQNEPTDNGENELTDNSEKSFPIIKKGERVSFTSKLSSLKENVLEYFNMVHNELVSFERIKSRISFRCISYRLGKKLLAKMTVRGKTLTLHLALDVDSFNERAFFQKDLSAVKLYGEVPFTVKIKSDRGARNAVKLVGALAEKFGLTKNVDSSNKLEQGQ